MIKSDHRPQSTVNDETKLYHKTTQANVYRDHTDLVSTAEKTRLTTGIWHDIFFLNLGMFELFLIKVADGMELPFVLSYLSQV